MKWRLPLVSLRYKLVSLTLLPLLALIWFQVNATIDRQTERKNVAELSALVEFSVGAGELLHDLQLERGATTIYLSSDGRRFANEVAKQRDLTDIQYGEFVSMVSERKLDLPPEVRDIADSALSQLEDLEATRRRATELSIDEATAFDFYTSSNASLLNIFSAIGLAATDADLTRQVISYNAMATGKELAGRERARLSTLFESNGLAPDELATVIGLISFRDAYLEVFAKSASPEMLEPFEAKQNDPIVAKVATFEAAAIDDANFDIDSALWFNVMTERIQLLKELEDLQAAELTTTTARLTSDANSALLGTILTIALVIALTLTLVGAIARQIMHQLDALSIQADRIAKGDLLVQELDLPGKDSIANLGSSFDRMSRTLHLIRNQIMAVSHRHLLDKSLSESAPGELGSAIGSLVEHTRERVELEIREKLASEQTAKLLTEVTTKADELRSTSRDLQHSKDRFETLIQNAFEAILIVDETGNLSYLSSPFELVLGHKAADHLGHPAKELLKFVHPEEVDRVSNQFRALQEQPGASTSMELRLVHADGSLHWIDLFVRNLLQDETVQGMVVNARDITKQKHFGFQLEHHAYHDALTGLPNRRLLLDRLEHALARTRRHGGIIGLLFLDLDGFKNINDSMGHEAGDSLLVTVAERIELLIRSSDTAARLGGDEFVVLGEDLKDADEVFLLGNRILESISRPININGTDLFVTASIGMDRSVNGNLDSKSMMRNADAAMYQAKQAGKNALSIHSRSSQVQH